MSVITFNCDDCGREFRVAEAQAGKRARCKSCGHETRIPHPKSTESLPAYETEPETIEFSCKRCGRDYQVGTGMAGKRVRCKGCGSPVSVPGERIASSVGKSSYKEPKAHDDSNSDMYGFDELPAAPPRSGAPKPSAPVSDLPALNRNWMAPSTDRPKKNFAATGSSDEGANAVRSGIGMIGFGLVATILPNFGLVLKARGGHALSPEATIGAGIFLAIIGAVVLAYGLYRQKHPAKPRERKGMSPLLIGVAVVFVVIVGGLSVLSMFRPR